MFTRKRKLPHSKPIRLDGVELNWEHEVKNLGPQIQIDNRNNMGIHSRILRYMYTAGVRPVITYGAIA